MKDPAHGLPCLSARIITGSFEQPMTQMKTKCDDSVNGSGYSSNCAVVIGRRTL